MYAFEIITVGQLKEQYYREIRDEYAKRLSAYCNLTRTELPAKKLPAEPSPAQIAGALDAEGKSILRSAKGAQIVAMCVEGKRFDSVSFADELRRYADAGKVAFVIGSSYGLSDEVKSAARLRLSVSDFTFPHAMMQPILYEILYRSCNIMAGGKYHK